MVYALNESVYRNLPVLSISISCRSEKITEELDCVEPGPWNIQDNGKGGVFTYSRTTFNR